MLRSIGLPELTTIVFMLGFIFLNVLIVKILLLSGVQGSRVVSWLMRVSEAAAYREPAVGSSDHKPMRQRSIQFPRALAICAVVSGLYVGVLSSHIMFHGVFEKPRPLTTIAFTGVTIVAGISVDVAYLRGVYLHFLPGHDRRNKYDWLLAGNSLAITQALCTNFISRATALRFFDGSALGTAFVDPQRSPLNATFIYVGLTLLILLNPAVLTLLLGGAAGSRWRRRRAKVKGQKPSEKLRCVYALVRWLAVPAALALAPLSAVAIPPLPIPPLYTLTYLLVRYFVTDDLLDRPIVYLRSFRYSAGPTAFGRVSKGAGSFGVITVIVHESQPGSSLMRDMGVLSHPQVFRLGDLGWQEWVLGQLRVASAIIIDVTIHTESIAWELEAALSTGKPDRIVLMVQKGVSMAKPNDVFLLEYALDKTSVKTARSRLKTWLEASFLAASFGLSRS